MSVREILSDAFDSLRKIVSARTRFPISRSSTVLPSGAEDAQCKTAVLPRHSRVQNRFLSRFATSVSEEQARRSLGDTRHALDALRERLDASAEQLKGQAETLEARMRNTVQEELQSVRDRLDTFESRLENQSESQEAQMQMAMKEVRHDMREDLDAVQAKQAKLELSIAALARKERRRSTRTAQRSSQPSKQPK